MPSFGLDEVGDSFGEAEALFDSKKLEINQINVRTLAMKHFHERIELKHSYYK